jgi:HK97 gp10 family phage protein
MAGTSQVLGLKELLTNLKKIKIVAEGDAAIAMTRSGANVFKKAAQEKVPVKTGKLKKSIYVKQISKGPHVLYVTTIRGGKNGVRYGHLVEFGTKAHEEPKEGKKAKGPMLIAKGGKLFWNVHHPGAEPHPFMRPAFDENAEKALTKMTNVYNRRIERWQTKIAAGMEE